MNFKIIIIYFLLLLFIGCFDIFREKETTLVGSISLINSNNEEDIGYSLVLEKSDFNSNIITDPVQDAFADDTLLIVKCVERIDCNNIYYKIRHNKGENPIIVKEIDSLKYVEILKKIKTKYSFHDTSPCSPRSR